MRGVFDCEVAWEGESVVKGGKNDFCGCTKINVGTFFACQGLVRKREATRSRSAELSRLPKGRKTNDLPRAPRTLATPLLPAKDGSRGRGAMASATGVW